MKTAPRLCRTDVFEVIRRWAYGWVGDCGSEAQFAIQVLNAARNYNREHFSTPLPEAEVQCIARSITQWTWKNKATVGTRRKGGMGLDRTLPLVERQRLSAQRTNANQRRGTEQRILQAMGQLTQQGEKITKVAVARKVGISRQALTNYHNALFKR